jgi:hypothetical protein
MDRSPICNLGEIGRIESSGRQIARRLKNSGILVIGVNDEKKILEIIESGASVWYGSFRSSLAYVLFFLISIMLVSGNVVKTAGCTNFTR